MMKWLDTYASHILHCSLYTGIAALAIKKSSVSSSNMTSTSYASMLGDVVLPLIVGGVATLSLSAELNYIYKRIGLPPGNSGYPIIGHLVAWMTNPRKFMTAKAEKYGLPYTANFLMGPAIVFSSDEDIQWCIVQERKGLLVPNFPDFMENLLGRESITFQSSRDHRRLRRIFEPSFSPKAVETYVQTMDGIAKEELEKWCTRRKNEHCTSDDWALLAMRIFMKCALGSVDETLLERLSSLLSTWFNGFMGLPIAVPGTALYEGNVAGDKALRLLQQMVDAFKSENPPGSPGAENSMMGRLCYGVDDDGKTLTDEQLVTNIRFIMFAGHDTTKGSFSAFLHFLSGNPKLQAALREEVSGFSEPLNSDELKAAPLLNAFFAETWRMVPPTDSHGTVATVDLEYKGYKIRKGVNVIADITYDCVTNEHRYRDPQEFHVERWLPKDHPMHDSKYYVGDTVDYNSLSNKFRAFAFGMHSCLGVQFAKLESRIVMTRLLQTYDLEVLDSKLIPAPLLQYNTDFKLTKKTK